DLLHRDHERCTLSASRVLRLRRPRLFHARVYRDDIPHTGTHPPRHEHEDSEAWCVAAVGIACRPGARCPLLRSGGGYRTGGPDLLSFRSNFAATLRNCAKPNFASSAFSVSVVEAACSSNALHARSYRSAPSGVPAATSAIPR